MTRFVEGCDRGQSTFFPALLDDYVAEDNPVRAIDAFVDGLEQSTEPRVESPHLLSVRDRAGLETNDPDDRV